MPPKKKYRSRTHKIKIKHKGALKKYDYSIKDSQEKRHRALKRAVKAYGPADVSKKLSAVATLSKKKNPSYSKKYKADERWVMSKYEGKTIKHEPKSDGRKRKTPKKEDKKSSSKGEFHIPGKSRSYHYPTQAWIKWYCHSKHEGGQISKEAVKMVSQKGKTHHYSLREVERMLEAAYKSAQARKTKRIKEKDLHGPIGMHHSQKGERDGMMEMEEKEHTPKRRKKRAPSKRKRAHKVEPPKSEY
jgi:hypothetical protein